MGLLDGFQNTFKSGAAAAERATRSYRLKSTIGDLAKQRQSLALQLGMSLYEATRTRPELRAGREPLYDGIAQIDRQIEAIQQELIRIEHEASEASAAQKTYLCPQCGSQIQATDRFCSGCGIPTERIFAAYARQGQPMGVPMAGYPGAPQGMQPQGMPMGQYPGTYYAGTPMMQPGMMPQQGVPAGHPGMMPQQGVPMPRPGVPVAQPGAPRGQQPVMPYQGVSAPQQPAAAQQPAVEETKETVTLPVEASPVKPTEKDEEAHETQEQKEPRKAAENDGTLDSSDKEQPEQEDADQKLTCPSCHEEVFEGDRFCMNCGKPLV